MNFFVCILIMLVALHVYCVSDGCHNPVNSDQVLSDEDLPAAAGAGDRRQVIRIRDVSPDVQIVDISQVGRDWDSRRTVWGAWHSKDIPGGRLQQSACVKALSPESGLVIYIRGLRQPT